MLSQDQINTLLQAAGNGDRDALDLVIPDLYEQLHNLASLHMKQESGGRVLQTTAIVHEAYFRLCEQRRRTWNDRTHFLATASVVMRRVLVDCARRERAAKRGGQAKRLPLCDARLAVEPNQSRHALEINEALEKLTEFAPEQAKALEMMIFAGMTGEEIANAVGVSASTIDRRIRAAKAWLRRELRDSAA